MAGIGLDWGGETGAHTDDVDAGTTVISGRLKSSISALGQTHKPASEAAATRVSRRLSGVIFPWTGSR